MFRNFPGRPDCEKENPEFDGTCPRRGLKQDILAQKYLFIGGFFLKFGTLPIQGGLMDQDIRFVIAIGVLSPEYGNVELGLMQKMMTKMMGIG